MSDEANSRNDAALIDSLQAGDPFAMESLYEQYSHAIYSLALRIMGDPREAEEVLQDTFCQLWRKASQFDTGRGSLMGWLLTIARHRAIGRIRAQKTRVRSEFQLEDTTVLPRDVGPSFLDQRITRELISAAFAGLPEAQQKAIMLAYFDGLTCEEIASRTQAPVGTVKTRLRSGLRTMKTILANPIVAGAPDWRLGCATLEDILATEELLSRVCRARDPQEETRVLDRMAEVSANSPGELINALLRVPVDLCKAGTGGLSLLETDSRGEQVFRWTHLSGVLAKYIGGTTPRNFSPCGVTLDCDSPQLFRYPARYFDYFQKVDIPIVEGLVIPFHIGGNTEGTIWVVSHDEGTHFDGEDARIMTSIAEFVGCAIHLDRQFMGGVS